MQSEKRKIRVLVVDDSAVMRKLIKNLLERDEDIEVVATAIDGDFALTKIESILPDVVTLDVDMPRMDGLTTLRHIVAKHKIPVVMLSVLTSLGAMLTMQALEIGAFDFVCKPKVSTQVGDMAEELILRVKGAARSRAVSLNGAENGVVHPPASGRKKRRPKGNLGDSKKIVAIGASSGGPHALRYLLPRIPPDIDAPILVVQHMMESFTPTFVRWLDEICGMEVREARDGDVAVPGRILVAPGGHHMTVQKTGAGAQVVLESGQPVSGHKPSVDVLFQSVAREYGLLGIGLIMTGMGSDGAQGIGEIRKAGGHTLAQDRESCSVYGMPRVAIEKGFVDTVLPLKEMPEYLISVVGQQSV